MKEKYKDIFTKTALCCSGFGMISNAVFVPASAEIMKAFPDAGSFVTGYVLSGNFIMSIPFAILSAWLARYISKKKLLIAALFMFFAGGFGNAFVSDMYLMAVARTLDAASDGVITTIAASLIAEVYKDEKTRSQVMGRKEAVASVLGIFTGFLSGLLVKFGWRYAFALNAFSLIPLVLGIIFIPNTKPEREQIKEKFRIDRKTAVHILGNLFCFGLIQLIFCQVIYLIAAIIEEEQIGGSVYAGAMSYPYYSVLIAQDVPEVQVSFWMSAYSVVVYTVASFSTYVPGFISRIFHTSTVLESFVYSGGLLVLVGLILTLSGKMRKKQLP